MAPFFGLQTATSPFQPALSLAPDGFELALKLSPVGANFNFPVAVTIDASGNLWVPNANGNTTTELIGAARPVLTPLVACLRKTPALAVCLP